MSQLALLDRWEGFSDEFLRTPEAKAFVLYEGAKHACRRTRNSITQTGSFNFPKVDDDIVQRAIRMALTEDQFGSGGNLAPAFLLASQYGRLEGLIDEIEAIEIEKPRVRTYQYNLKTQLVSYVLLPLERYQEAIELLRQCGELKQAIEVAARISPEAATELCEELHGFFEEGLRAANGREDLETRLRRSHVASYIDGTYRDHLGNVRGFASWRDALNKAQEYEFSRDEVRILRLRALEYWISGFETSLLSEDRKGLSSIDSIFSSIDELVSEEERSGYYTRALTSLEQNGLSYEAMKWAHALGYHNRTVDLGLQVLGTNLEERTREEVRDIVGDSLRQTKDAENAKELIRKLGMSFDNFRGVLRFVRDIGIDGLRDWVLTEYEGVLRDYESRGLYEQAARIAESMNLEGRRVPSPKDLYIKAERYDLAINFAGDDNEKEDLMLLEGRRQLLLSKNKLEYKQMENVTDAIRWFAEAINTARSGIDLGRPLAIARNSLIIMLEHGFYVEAVSFAKTYGIGDIGEMIPDTAFEDYERRFEFGRCKLVAEAKGRLQHAFVYDVLDRLRNTQS